MIANELSEEVARYLLALCYLYCITSPRYYRLLHTNSFLGLGYICSAETAALENILVSKSLSLGTPGSVAMAVQMLAQV